MADKMTKKELRAPDAFQKAAAEAGEWVQGRSRMVTIAVVVVLLGFSGVAVASYVSSRGEEKAAADLGSALAVVSRPVEGQSSFQARPEGEKPFKTEQEKDETIVKAMEDFQKHHHGTKALRTAELTQGEAELRLGRYDDAIKTFDGYLQAAPGNEPLRATALEGKGYAFEGKHAYDQALQAFEQLSREDKVELLNGMGMYHRARVLLEQGKEAEAAAAFSEVKDKFPSSAAGRLSGERLTLLAAAGIKPAPAPAAVPVAADAGR